MSAILDKLLKGQKVEWKTLGDVSVLYGGLTGKNKADFENGNAKYVSYKNIFANLAVDLQNLGTVKANDNEKQHFIKHGDILFTGSSETQAEAGISSVVTEHPIEKIYLNSFSFGLRFNDDVELMPEFTKFLFRGDLMRTQIARTASGVTRFNISKERFKKIQVPIPPLDVQAEIVRILDAFTALTAELTQELAKEKILREKQYQYYRDCLLTFENSTISEQRTANSEQRTAWQITAHSVKFNSEIRWKKLSELGQLIRGNGLQKSDFTEDGFPAIHYGQIYTFYGTFADKTKSFVSENLAKKLKKAQNGDVLLAGTSENIQDVMKPLGWLGNEIAISGDMFAYRPNTELDTKYLTYLLQTTEFQKYKEKYAHGTKVTRLNAEKFLRFEIAIPPLNEQKRIANILDKFEALTHSITEGLPKEITLRKQQYEYYREQLLDFPRN